MRYVGLWLFRRKSDAVFIGRGGLKTYQIDGKDVIGSAYAVLPDYWNQGFATKMARVPSKLVWIFGPPRRNRLQPRAYDP